MSTHRIRMTASAAVAIKVTSDSLDRLNHGPQEPQRHWRVVVPPMTTDGTRTSVAVEAKAVPKTSNDVPDDATLGGKLYRWSWGEEGAVPPPSITTTVRSGIASWSFDERHVGLWLLTCWREDNGGATMPLEVSIG